MKPYGVKITKRYSSYSYNSFSTKPFFWMFSVTILAKVEFFEISNLLKKKKMKFIILAKGKIKKKKKKKKTISWKRQIVEWNGAKLATPG